MKQLTTQELCAVVAGSGRRSGQPYPVCRGLAPSLQSNNRPGWHNRDSSDT